MHLLCCYAIWNNHGLINNMPKYSYDSQVSHLIGERHRLIRVSITCTYHSSFIQQFAKILLCKLHWLILTHSWSCNQYSTKDDLTNALQSSISGLCDLVIILIIHCHTINQFTRITNKTAISWITVELFIQAKKKIPWKTSSQKCTCTSISVLPNKTQDTLKNVYHKQKESLKGLP